MDRIDAGHDDDVGGERLRAGQATPGAKAETLKAEMLKAEDGSGEKQKVESRKQKSEGGGANIERPTSNIQRCPVKWAKTSLAERKFSWRAAAREWCRRRFGGC